MKTLYITEKQRNLIKENHLLLEDAGNEELKKAIKDCVPRTFFGYPLNSYLDRPLRELPREIKSCLNPGNEPTEMFRAVENGPDGNNTFLTFLRVNFLQQFGMTHNNGPKKYMKGIARIAIRQLGFYSFDPNTMKGGKIVNLGRIMRVVSRKSEMLENYGITFDKNLNGLWYNGLVRTLEPFLDGFRNEEYEALRGTEIVNTPEYKITRIDDTITNSYGTRMCVPKSEFRPYFQELSRYCDWCILTKDYEYGQYTSNGGKFYICEKHGYKNIQREPGENCPLDEYGLSLIAVLIGPDGLPDEITTRWNHDYGGEGHKDLWMATQLQKILKVDYRTVFQPRNETELRMLGVFDDNDDDNDDAMMNEDAISAQDQVHNKVNSGIMDAVTCGGMLEEDARPENDKYIIGAECGDSLNPNYHINEENENEEKEFRNYCKEISEFMKENGLHVFPFPKLNFDWSEQDGLFIRTGYYTPEEKEVTIFCKDRHPKDILRSFAHEMIHHAQNLDGKDLNFSSNDDVKDNKKLEKLEAEAYLKGNIYFRKWTEFKNAQKTSLNESIDKDLNMLENTDPDNIDLSSFNIKKELNPKFWKNGLLDSRIRIKLMDIADDFIDFLGVDWVKPDDIIMTGSLANFNWNKKYSDIDLHILIDFSKVDKRKDFVKKYFDSQKNLWNEEHGELSIFGFPVELYVQDTNENHTSTGVYSLDRNEWIKEPERKKLATSKVNKALIKNKVANYINKIDDLENDYKDSKGDDYKIRKISEKLEKLFNEIKNERKKELNNNKNGNEISNGNIIFKCLRRLNYIDKLYDLKTKTYDKMNSLP